MQSRLYVCTVLPASTHFVYTYIHAYNLYHEVCMYMAYAYLARQNSALPINMCAADNRVNSSCPTSRQLCLIVEGTVVNLARQEALVSELITSGQAYCNRQCVPPLLERPHGVLTLVSLLYSRVFLGRVQPISQIGRWAIWDPARTSVLATVQQGPGL